MFAEVFAALFVGHQLGDHWIQTDSQARRKVLPGWPGRIACTAHVATYGLTQLATLGALALVLDVRPSLVGLTAGMLVNLASHYVADRRTPLHWLADRTGSARFYRLGAPRPDRDDNPSLGTGAYALDQSWHYTFLFIAALIITA